MDLRSYLRHHSPGAAKLPASQPPSVAEKAMLGISTFTPGTDTPQKVHTEEEFAYVLSGHGRITVGDEYVEYGPGSFIHIPAGVPHGVANPGTEDMIMIFGFSWPTYPPTSDA